MHAGMCVKMSVCVNKRAARAYVCACEHTRAPVHIPYACAHAHIGAFVCACMFGERMYVRACAYACVRALEAVAENHIMMECVTSSSLHAGSKCNRGNK